MARSSLARLLLLALLPPSCGGDPENPLASVSVVASLRPTSAIVFVSDAYAPRPSGLRDVFAIDEDGSNMTRITSCNTTERSCDSPEVAPAPDRKRLAIRRITTDTDGNGRPAPGDAESVVIADTERKVEGALTLQAVSGAQRVTTDRLSGLDWSPTADILVYSALAEGGLDDLFRSVPRPDTDGTQTRNLTISAALRERHGRIDPTGNFATYDRTDANTKSEIWIFQNTVTLQRVTSGGPGSDVLPGAQLVTGSDTNPDYSPDGQGLVFRRLTGTGNGGLGSWDLMTVRTSGSSLAAIASGPLYRSAPDWGPKGIVFSEIDRATGRAQLVVIQPDGSGRRVIATFNGFDVQSPRWLPAAP